jgi:hypothetical protein
MAAASGNPELDAAIDAFRARGVWHVEVMDWFDDCYVSRERPLDELKSVLGARGNCIHITNEFNEFLTELGLDASMPVDNEGRPITVSPEAFGYGDRPLSGLSEHMLSLVPRHGIVYSVDWTAAQFGYGEFPLIQRYEDGEWQRDWESRARESELAA